MIETGTKAVKISVAYGKIFRFYELFAFLKKEKKICILVLETKYFRHEYTIDLLEDSYSLLLKQIFMSFKFQACLYSWENKVPLIAFTKDRCLTLFDDPLVDSLHTVYREPKVPYRLNFLSYVIVIV